MPTKKALAPKPPKPKPAAPVKEARARKPKSRVPGDNGAIAPGTEVMDELRRLREQMRLLHQENEELRAKPAPSAIIHQEAGAFVPKELPDEIRDERARIAENLPVPGRDAPMFNLVNDFLTLGVTPWADVLVPAYVLDKNYRIVDWNTALGLAFDRTMEGRRGLSVLEWTYFFDNYEESLTRATKDFGDPANLPRLHVETIKYTSPRYGPITAIKRAYQVPKDDGEILGWLVTLDTQFADLETTLQFKRDLFTALRRNFTWSEYALSYDRVLLATAVYRELLDHIVGERGNGGPDRIPQRSRILDLGAGTGNVALLLAKQQRGHVIFALENNRTMLDMLRIKCEPYLRVDDNGAGILPIKQDVNSLFGIPQESFHQAILNNVAYTLEDPLPCFRQVHKALMPNGEIRVSGPQKKTKLTPLFARIEADLKTAGQWETLGGDFDRVWEINRNVLSSSLYRWTIDDMAELLRTAGFSKITYKTDSAYAGQALIIVARK